jgi:hypothetical protein
MEAGATDLSEGQVDRLHAQLVSLANRFGMLEGSIARVRQRLDSVLGALDDGQAARFSADDDESASGLGADLDELRGAIDSLGTRIDALAANVEAAGQDPLAQTVAPGLGADSDELRGAIDSLGTRIDALAANVEAAGQDALAQRAAVAAANASRTAEATNEALAGLRQAVDELGARPAVAAPTGKPSFDAELIAATATALAAIESRLDREFVAVNDRLDALTTAVNQTTSSPARHDDTGVESRLDRGFVTINDRLDALTAVLNQTASPAAGHDDKNIEPQAVTEKMRQAANSLVEALKARSARSKDSSNNPR